MPKDKKKVPKAQKKKRKYKYPHEHRGFAKAMYSAKTRWQVEGIEKLYAKLNDAEREWYSRFLLEFHNGAVNKNDPNAIHQTKAERKICYDRKNAANRDLFSLLNANGGFMTGFNDDEAEVIDSDEPNYVSSSNETSE